MDLYYRLKQFQHRFIKNQIIFLISVFIALLILLLLLITGLFLNRLILLALISIPLYSLYSFSRCSFFKIAQRIEHSFSEIKGKLIPALQLYQYQQTLLVQKENYSSELITAAIEQVNNQIKNLPLKNLINYKKTWYALIVTFILIFIMLGFIYVTPTHFRFGWKLAFAPQDAPLFLNISPGNTFVNKDSVVNLRLNFTTPIKNLSATIYAKGVEYTSKESLSINIKADKAFSYYFIIRSAWGVPIRRSPTYQIKLFEPIEITDLVFFYHYPSYTKLPVSQQRVQEINALLGTKVYFQAIASDSLISAYRINSIGLTETLSVNNREFKGHFTVIKPDSFYFLLKGNQQTQGKSFWYAIRPRFDESPYVRIFAPGQDLDVPVNMQVLIGMYGIDDFGINRFYLYWFKSTSTETSRILVKSSFGKNEDTAYYLWDLNKIIFLPGEEINYFAEIYDNDAVSGNKFSRSETYIIRFPTLNEIYSQVTEKTQTTIEKLSPLAKTEQKISQQLEKITEKLKAYRNLDWEEKSTLSEVLSEKQKLISEIKALQDEINNTISELYQGLMIDKETLEKLQEISKILSEILPQDLKEKLQILAEQALQKNPDLSKSLEQLKLSSDEMKQALSRALELLKNLQKEALLQSLARKAEEVFKQQSQLHHRIDNEKLSNLIQPQQQIGEEIKDLQNQINGLSKTFDDSAIQAQLSDIANELNKMQLSSQVNTITQNLSQNQKGQAKKGSQELLQDLKRLKERLQELADSYKQNQHLAIMERLLKNALALNQLSQEQEQIINQSNQALSRNLVLTQMRLVEATRVLAESIASLSEKSILIPIHWVKDLVKTFTLMERASTIIEDALHNNAQITQAQVLQKEAISQIDKTTLQILQFLSKGQMPNNFGAGLESLLQALSQLTAEQMMLGQQMGGMIPLPISGGLSQEQLSQLQRLLSMQSQLRSALEQLLQDINTGKYGELPGLSGSVEGAIEEMKNIEKDLSELNISRKTIERQEKIINRMLDAQRSIRQKEYSEKREREIGKDYSIPPSPILDKNLGETKKRLREELLRALQEGYPKEYETMIKNYFETIIQE
ncbi:MAG: hypothetical protein N2201_02260 [candidate division WOR-3 bacterium]|nr:hypothetical protein [candidate division WOR-3 bacterium]